MKFYLVAFNKQVPEENVLTIVKTKNQAKIYIILHLLHKHHEHFTQWCEIHERDETDFNVQNEYVLKVWFEELNDYVVMEKKFNKDNMMHCLRILAGAIPVGGYWEDEDEMLVQAQLEAQQV